jgi:hypothetical protein
MFIRAKDNVIVNSEKITHITKATNQETGTTDLVVHLSCGSTVCIQKEEQQKWFRGQLGI